MADHFSVIVAQTSGFVVGMAAATLAGSAIARTISVRLLYSLCLIFLLPGLALAVAIALRSPDVSPLLTGTAQGLFVAPLASLPIVLKVSRLTPGLVRAGKSLGAGRIARLRLIWLPLFAPAFVVSIVLAASILGGCIALHGS